VTLDPDSHPSLALVLPYINRVEFNEESLVNTLKSLNHADVSLLPEEWTEPTSPPDEYYMYYLWASLQSLNLVRKIKKLSKYLPLPPPPSPLLSSPSVSLLLSLFFPSH
jgi:hypothetical protein